MVIWIGHSYWIVCQLVCFCFICECNKCNKFLCNGVPTPWIHSCNIRKISDHSWNWKGTILLQGNGHIFIECCAIWFVFRFIWECVVLICHWMVRHLMCFLLYLGKWNIHMHCKLSLIGVPFGVLCVSYGTFSLDGVPFGVLFVSYINVICWFVLDIPVKSGKCQTNGVPTADLSRSINWNVTPLTCPWDGLGTLVLSEKFTLIFTFRPWMRVNLWLRMRVPTPFLEQVKGVPLSHWMVCHLVFFFAICGNVIHA